MDSQEREYCILAPFPIYNKLQPMTQCGVLPWLYGVLMVINLHLSRLVAAHDESTLLWLGRSFGAPIAWRSRRMG